MHRFSREWFPTLQTFLPESPHNPIWTRSNLWIRSDVSLLMVEIQQGAEAFCELPWTLVVVVTHVIHLLDGSS